MKFIRTSINDAIAVITFNNDIKRNSLNSQLLAEVENTFDRFANEDIRVVILRSKTESKVWSAGLDINELPDPGKDPVPYSHPVEKLMRKIEEFKAPVIAMITGTVWGAAFDLAVTCDMIIASPNSSFAITPAKLGVAYNATGLTHFLNVVEMNTVKEMFFTAKPISATRAYNLGIINSLVDKNEIEDYTYNLAKNITQNSPLSISIIKEQLNLLGKSRSLTPDVFERINELRSCSYNSYDFVEGKAAFTEKRKPVFKGE